MSWFKFFAKSITSWGTIVSFIVGTIGNWDYFVSRFVADKPNFVQTILDYWPKWSWQTWIIISLIIFMISAVTKAHQMYKGEAVKSNTLRLKYESDRLELKNNYDNRLQKLWEGRVIAPNEPINLSIVEETAPAQLINSMIDMAKAVYPKNVITFLRRYMSQEEGVLHIQNVSKEPIRLRATGLIIDSNYELNNTARLYVIQWQGIPDEDKVLWPNDDAILYVVCFGLKQKSRYSLLPDRVLLFPSQEREKNDLIKNENFRVNFMIENPNILNVNPFDKKKPKRTEIKLQIVLSANSLINPSKGNTMTLITRIRTDGIKNSFKIISSNNN